MQARKNIGVRKCTKLMVVNFFLFISVASFCSLIGLAFSLAVILFLPASYVFACDAVDVFLHMNPVQQLIIALGAIFILSSSMYFYLQSRGWVK